jgi:hypothetical protein
MAHRYSKEDPIGAFGLRIHLVKTLEMIKLSSAGHRDILLGEIG